MVSLDRGVQVEPWASASSSAEVLPSAFPAHGQICLSVGWVHVHVEGVGKADATRHHDNATAYLSLPAPILGHALYQLWLHYSGL